MGGFAKAAPRKKRSQKTRNPRTRRKTKVVKRLRVLLGERLRTARKRKELSQERLGNLSDLSGKFIGEVERGIKSISVDSLYRVATALGVPLRALTDLRPGRR